MFSRQSIIISLVLLTLSIGGLFIYFQQSQEKNKPQPTPEMMVKADVAMISELDVGSASAEQAMMPELGQAMGYVQFSPEQYDASAGKRHVLFFYANWCPTCRAADTDFLKNAEVLSKSVSVVRINYNDTDTSPEEKELAQKYQITYQHSFVLIDESGTELNRWNGGQTEELLNNSK
ncbi:thioredoxin family protein [Candidatus Woesebacteria bacterium]|nr:thioredoxin family protein [Candidatus Woesebacteria bacterium]